MFVRKNSLALASRPLHVRKQRHGNLHICCKLWTVSFGVFYSPQALLPVTLESLLPFSGAAEVEPWPVGAGLNCESLILAVHFEEKQIGNWFTVSLCWESPSLVVFK